MSTEATTWAWQTPGLSPATRLLLLVLADTCNHLGYSEVEREYLASRTGQSAEIVQRRLREMEDAGLIRPLGKGLRLLASEQAKGAAEPITDPESRALREQRLLREMEARRATVEHTPEERKRVQAKAEATKRALEGARFDPRRPRT